MGQPQTLKYPPGGPVGSGIPCPIAAPAKNGVPGLLHLCEQRVQQVKPPRRRRCCSSDPCFSSIINGRCTGHRRDIIDVRAMSRHGVNARERIGTSCEVELVEGVSQKWVQVEVASRRYREMLKVECKHSSSRRSHEAIS